MDAGTIIKAGASILGGLLGRKGHDAGGNSSLAIRGQAHGARMAAEQFGFNPLTLLGVSSAVAGSQNNAVLGQGIANAGLAIADGMDTEKLLQIERQKVAQDQKRLDALIEKQTLRPRVGGVYSTQSQTPSRGGVGSPNPTMIAAPQVKDRLRPLTNTEIVDPRRPNEVAPVKNSAGFMVVDNPYLPIKLYGPTLDGDEPLQWYDLPSVIPAAVIGAGAAAYQKGQDIQSEAWKRKLVASYGSKPSLRPYPDTRFDPKKRDGYVTRQR